ncbi:hypothetical protein RB653_007602 [Dictyostelium firmibasis]|uniref:AB hydrolase-1 domain-containing protein n=1 Tax=Dictyostelium firmibasis TaxID=79012 RepID=A0AAN7TVW2_9MYCE
MVEETKSTLKKRETKKDKEVESEVIEDKKKSDDDTNKGDKRESIKKTEDNKKQKQQPQQVQPKNAFCIRFIGIVLITIVTFSVWSVFNHNNNRNVDASFFIKEMPEPLLRHYQSGQMIPVFDKSTGGSFNLFIVQQSLDWSRPDPRYSGEVDRNGKPIIIREDIFYNNEDISDEVITQTNSVDNEVALIIHGQTTTSFAFRKTLKYIQKERIHPIAIDLPCFGFSDPLANCSYSEIADRIDDILDSLQIRKPVHLVLYDTGASIGTSFAIKHSNRVRSILYIDPHIDMSNTPLYYNIIKTPFFGQLYIQFLTSPYFSTLRYKLLGDRFNLYNSYTVQSDVDSYFYCLRYRNNIQNFIDTVKSLDTTFRETYRLTTSSIALNGLKPIHLILTTRYVGSYQSQLFQKKFGSSIKHTDTTETFSLFFEDNPSSISLQLADIIDSIDEKLRIEKPKPKPVQQQQQHQQQEQGHGHSHGSGNSHGHSHGSHGHSHGSGNSHGHSHGSGNSHGHSHGGGDQYGLGHNYGM